MSTKVMKVNEPKTTVTINKIEFEIKPINIDMRCEIMDRIIATEGTPSFTSMVEIILMATNLSKEDLNQYDNKTLGSLFAEITNRCDSSSTKKK